MTFFGGCFVSIECSNEVSVMEMRNNLSRAHAAWHEECFACSRQNIHGLHLDFSVNDKGIVETLFPCDVIFKGFSDYLHGGISATLLDAAMTNCLFAHGFVGLTGELKVRFYEPIALNDLTCIRAWLQYSSHRLHVFHAEMVQDGTVKVRASGKFLEKKIK
jgi:acyl-coenzyme A thioesterase PaaI-like protein